MKNEIEIFFKQQKLAQCYQLKSNVVFKTSNDKIVALTFDEDDLIFEIDGLSRELWDAIVKKENIVERMALMIEGKTWNKDLFFKDCHTFISELIKNKLITEISK